MKITECGKPPVVSFGKPDIKHVDGAKSGETVAYTCDPGHNFETAKPTSVLCGSGGSYGTSVVPICGKSKYTCIVFLILTKDAFSI